MYRKISAMLAIGMTFAGNAYGQATKDPDPALNNPDKVSWELRTRFNKTRCFPALPRLRSAQRGQSLNLPPLRQPVPAYSLWEQARKF
jgi:hypothetical protein